MPSTEPRRKRVVHVTSAHPANDPRIFRKECHALHRAGLDVHLVATGERPDAPFPVHVLSKSGHRLARTSLGSARAVLATLRLRPWVVHLHDPELIPWIPVFRLLGIAVVFDSHEDIPATMSDHPTFGRAVRTILGFVYRRLVTVVSVMSNAVIAATPTIAQGYRNPRVVVVQNFPDLGEWDGARATPPTVPTLVYVGGVSEQRGAWQMLDAMQTLGPELNARLKIAGSVRPELMSELTEHPGWDHVDFLGQVDRQGIVELMTHASLGLVLFQPSANNIASQPTKLFEYMAAGLPVLTSDYPLWRQLVCDAGAGTVVGPADVPGIIDSARAILTDTRLAREMGTRGRASVYRYRNWNSEAAQLVDLYRTLLEDVD